ncbi:hypothetical protein OSB04_019733 [Centaurea solstitialis]|uniref:Uncharacterized protein n=1 Tax=Centaurea solstitialis TaxID=347529 RepID=A0AA38WCN2_9ASTR|nr:hypothetical protein OSB04_019733 [Centaurea solstitialis]
MAYGISGDAFDEYACMGEKTSRDCLNNFCTTITEVYGQLYLRKPSYQDIQQLYAAHEARHEFLGMLGNLDCMHWDWGNFPVRGLHRVEFRVSRILRIGLFTFESFLGQFKRGDQSYPSIILEAAASQDTWIWRAFFGFAGAMNALNVLGQSPVFDDVYDGKAPECPF